MHKLLDFPMRKITEGSSEIFIPAEEKISKKLPVFYNPAMKLNRDATILLLQQFPAMSLCDPLAGTGIRAIRLAKEVKHNSITANDLSERSAALIKKNMGHNNVKFEVKNEDANIMLLKSTGFDFIDLDVFGSSNFMLDSAIKRVSRNGILAVTNTDTAALTGTYPEACVRKYWAKAKRDYLMHETGLRILIRKVQLIGMQYEKALSPIFSYFKEHYFRVFFRCIKGKKLCDEISGHHGMFNDAGPLWLGNLWDNKLADKMHSALLKAQIGNKPLKTDLTKNKILTKKNIIISNNQDYNKLLNFLKTIKEESKINAAGFYDMHGIAEKRKSGRIMKKSELIEKIRGRGFKAAETHFSGTGIRTDISYDKLLMLLKE